MWDWLRKLTGAKEDRPAHPPWAAGQYVTYYLQRDDGSWAALAIRNHGQLKDGAWGLSVDIKSKSGECRAWFRSDPAAPPNAMDPMPGKVERIRGGERRPGAGVKEMTDEPMMAAAMVMNLFGPRRWPKIAETLRGAPRSVGHPCGIDEAYSLVTPVPGIGNKHLDLHPRVMLTGLACMAFDGNKSPVTVTSFGWMDDRAGMEAPYDDHVDLSHPKEVDHGGFALTYPATWFLRPKPGNKEKQGDLDVTQLGAFMGGNTCSTAFSVDLFHGAKEAVRAERDAIVHRMEHTHEDPNALMSPRPGGAPVLSGGAKAFAFDYDAQAIAGVAINSVFSAGAGERLARVSLFGCIAKASPRREKTLKEMRRAFGAVAESFRFT